MAQFQSRTQSLRDSLRPSSQTQSSCTQDDKIEPAGSPPLQRVETAAFFSLSDNEVIEMCGKAFGPEFELLKNAQISVEASPVKAAGGFPADKGFASQQLFGTQWHEVDRTILGILILKWLVSNDYEAFVGSRVTPGQGESVRLCQESFWELRAIFMQNLRTDEDVYALIVSTIINDLGKDPNMATRVAPYLPKISEHDRKHMNHDTLIYHAAKNGQLDLLNGFDQSSSLYRILLKGLELGAEVNIAQLAQAENVPGSLTNLKGILAQNLQAFDFKFMELILDVAGAAGDKDSRYSMSMTDPVWQGFQSARSGLLGIIFGHCSLREGYDQVLTKRKEMVQSSMRDGTPGFDRPLSITDPSQRALLRLLAMGRCTNAAQAEPFAQAFDQLPAVTRQALVDGLSVDGTDDGVAILPYYMPALFGAVARKDTAAKLAALGGLMRFLARVFRGTRPAAGKEGLVVEFRLQYLTETGTAGAGEEASDRSSLLERFLQDPSVLDWEEIPDDQYSVLPASWGKSRSKAKGWRGSVSNLMSR